MPRGRKKNYKGGHKHFTNMEELEKNKEKEQKEKEWKRARGIESDSESGSDQSGEEDDPYANLDEEKDKKKGIEHLIDIQNPNMVKRVTKKVTELNIDDDDKGGAAAKPQLTRKEREELEKQQAKERYMKAHLAGKTEEAKADMARLALIRKQREEAAKKRAEELKAKEDAKKAAEQKLLERRKGGK